MRRCIQERQIDLIEEDIQDLLETGMRNTDPSLPSLSNERLIDRLVEVFSPARCALTIDVVVILQHYTSLLRGRFPSHQTIPRPRHRHPPKSTNSIS